MMIQFSTLFFYMFAACIITSSLLVVILSNPVHSVLALITTFLSAAGLFIMIGADFIALSLIIVYVGAVAVLFLFVVMMLSINNNKTKTPVFYTVFSLLITSMLMANFYMVITKSRNTQNIVPEYAINKEITNTASIGNILYTEFFYPFQLAGVLLLLAMVAAIVLTDHKKKSVKRQNMLKQFNRTRAESVELVDVEFNRGVKSGN